MFVQFTVDQYSVAITNFKLQYGYIMLFDGDNNRRVRMNFSTLPDINETTDVTISGSFIEVKMNINFFDDVVDILRNEKPVNITANSSNNIFILATGKEPVGEEETHQFIRFPIGISHT